MAREHTIEMQENGATFVAHAYAHGFCITTTVHRDGKLVHTETQGPASWLSVRREAALCIAYAMVVHPA